VESGFEMKILTPKQAVLAFCKQCCDNTKDCQGDHMLSLPDETCLFHKYRLGKGRPHIKLIRQQCFVVHEFFCSSSKRMRHKRMSIISIPDGEESFPKRALRA